MNMDLRDFANLHLWGAGATHGPAPRAARHAALLVLAGRNPAHPRALLGTPITTRASALNGRF
jgi:hypothetical protein